MDFDYIELDDGRNGFLGIFQDESDFRFFNKDTLVWEQPFGSIRKQSRTNTITMLVLLFCKHMQSFMELEQRMATALRR